MTHPQVMTELVSDSGGHAEHADQVVLRDRQVFKQTGVQTDRCSDRQVLGSFWWRLPWPQSLTTLTPPDRSLEHMEACEAIPTVVPSKDSPLWNQSPTVNPPEPRPPKLLFWWGAAHMTSWALSWRSRGSSSLVLHSRKLFRVSVGLFSTWILSRSLQISRPVSATRTLRGR